MRMARSSTHRARRRRGRPALVGAAAAATALALLGAWNATATPGTDATRANGGPGADAVRWEADPAQGTKVFEGVEKKPGEIGVVDDPTGRHGKTYRLHTSGEKTDPDERVRVETRGHRTPDGERLRFQEGDKVYIGWRSLWDPLPTAEKNWVALWQLKDYGSGAATPPLSLRARGNGAVDLEYCDPDLKTTELWHADLKTGQWYDFVVGLTVSDDPAKGKVEFWANGEKQQLKGEDVFKGATLRADWVTDKWGVYRSDGVKGPATAYLNSAKVGTSYEDVAP
ncbi:heparin lyase I family protein [Streptomyces albiaxialis]|uniref:Heparin lyase I family protein n=1 Tax=Streptomyces albiaxialis TaxID=329523 RepID=A0ABN2VNM8_9ACTN